MDKNEGFLLIGTSMIILVALVISILAVMLIYRKRKVEHEKEKAMINEEHAKELLTAQLEMQQQTMEYIGREIHDSVGQKLTLASLYAQQIDYEKQYPQISERIAAVGNIINESLSELRSLSKSLTDDHIGQTDLIILIQQECTKINSTGLCIIHFNTNIQKLPASYTIKNITMRIVQEFIQNSLKHGGCTEININIESTNEGLNIVTTDNGKGFDINQVGNKKGIGLNNMKKRAAIIGAIIKIQSQPGEGTNMQLFIPTEKFNL